MKKTRNLIGMALISLLFAACQKDSRFITESNDTEKKVEATAARGGHHGDNESGPGMVYTLSNKTDGNKVMSYRRTANGKLSFDEAYPTGGNGTGGGLGNQGAVVFADNG